MRINVDKNKLEAVCRCYGLDVSKALYYTNVVVIPGLGDLYVTLDKDCNVIDVREYNNKYVGQYGQYRQYNYFEGIYTMFNDDIMFELMLDYQGDLNSALSLGTIIKITDKYSKDFGGKLDDNFSEDQRLLVSYFSFLRHTMDRYLLHTYRSKSLGYNVPVFEDYIKAFVDMINRYVEHSLKKNRRPDSHEFACITGQNIFFMATGNDDIMKLLTKCNGYKTHPIYPNAVIPLDNNEEHISLDNLIKQMKDTIIDKEVEKSVQKKKGRKKKDRR